MNVLFFLRPKVSTAYIYYDNTLRQGLEKMRHYGYSAIPVLDREGHNQSVNVNASLEDLFIMAQNQNFVPVTDDLGSFIGIVTRRDILQYYYKLTHEQASDSGAVKAEAKTEHKAGDIGEEK